MSPNLHRVLLAVLVVSLSGVGSVSNAQPSKVSGGSARLRPAPRARAADRAATLKRFGFRSAAGKRTSRVAATTVLTEHPSSLKLLGQQLGELKRLMRTPDLQAGQLLNKLQQPYMTMGRQAHEFRHLSLKKGIATAKMIDFEGKPMPPSVIKRYVKAIERRHLTPGIEGDRLLYVRLPGAAEKTPKDRALRAEVFETIVDTNLERVMRGKGLPVDRLIVPDCKKLDELIEVHRTYDTVATRAVDRAVAEGRLPASARQKTLRALKQVQAVPLVEDAHTVMNAHDMVRGYLSHYRRQYKDDPKHLVVFVAGSDLNREVGPVAGQIAREVMRSRLAKVQKDFPGVDLVPWIGNGSAPMRSGVGNEPHMASTLHPGMTATIQPDQLDQRNLGQVIEAVGQAALKARPRQLSTAQEQKLVALGGLFADVHAQHSLEGALSTVRLANLLSPVNQRGRKKISSNLFYEKDGELYLRSVQPKESADASTYGRRLVVDTYTAQISEGFGAVKARLVQRQKTIDKHWPKGLSDPRAIGGTFARYIQGNPLTTVAGLGTAIKRAEASFGAKEVGKLRPLLSFLVRNDGFVLTKDRALVKKRITTLRPELNERQVEVKVKRYFADLAELERYLGSPIEDHISTRDRALYEKASHRLFDNTHFRAYIQGQDIRIKDWVSVMEDVVKVLANPSWNRVG